MDYKLPPPASYITIVAPETFRKHVLADHLHFAVQMNIVYIWFTVRLSLQASFKPPAIEAEVKDGQIQEQKCRQGHSLVVSLV